MDKFGNCHQCDQFCEGATDKECFACGEWTCEPCSNKRKYYSFGMVRLCNDCTIEYDGTERRVLKKMELQSA